MIRNQFFKMGECVPIFRMCLGTLQDPALRQRLTANAYKIFVQKLSWCHEFQTYLELLHHLLPGITEMGRTNTQKGPNLRVVGHTNSKWKDKKMIILQLKQLRILLCLERAGILPHDI